MAPADAEKWGEFLDRKLKNQQFYSRIRKLTHLSTFQIILIGFAAVIFIGALILMLPISSRSREVTPFLDALFTSTSATCVTGLIVHDTQQYWSLFGQAVILVLIQIGGLGVVTVSVTLAYLSGRRISLMQRSVLRDSISSNQIPSKSSAHLFCTRFSTSALDCSKACGMRFFIRSPRSAMRALTSAACAGPILL